MRNILSYSFGSAQEQWSKVPVDDVGYIPVSSMLTMRDKELCGVGYYANWFNKERLNYFVGDFLSIQNIEYITKDERYLVAVLKQKG